MFTYIKHRILKFVLGISYTARGHLNVHMKNKSKMFCVNINYDSGKNILTKSEKNNSGELNQLGRSLS